METNLVNTNGVSSSFSAPPDTCAEWLVIILMLTGAVLGTLALWSFQLSMPSSPEKKDIWAPLKNFGMATGAVALVPAFLRSISSTLMTQMKTSIEARFVFIGFSVAAAFAARRFLGTIPEKLLDSVKQTAADVKSKLSENDERVEKVAEIVANKTASTQEPSEEMKQKLKLSSVSSCNWYDLLVIRALLDPQYPNNRSCTGIALDTGLNVEDALACLKKMQANGDVRQLPMETKKGTWWALTEQGKKKFYEYVKSHAPDIQTEKTGFQ